MVDYLFNFIIFNYMVENKNLNRIFGALADPTRRILLDILKFGPKRVTELAESFEISLNAVSKHIKYLEKAGLIIRHQKGRDHIITLNPKPLDSAISLLNYYQEFWQRQLNSLENFLNKQSEKGE